MSNRDQVVVTFWPFFEQGLAMPFFLALLVPVALAFLFGWIAGWWRSASWRKEAKRRARRNDKLAAEVRRLRARQTEADESEKRAAESARLEAASKRARTAAEQEAPAGTGGPALTPPARTPVPAATAASPAIEGRPH